MQTQPHLSPKSKLGYLINFLEIWKFAEPEKGTQPSTDQTLKLQSSVAFHGDSVTTLDVISKEISKGDGIAGSAWQQEAPVILQDASAELEHAAARIGMPISSLLAIPIFDNFELVNIVVLGFAPGHGGLEIWTRDDRDELAISGSYYDGLRSFDFISQYVRFPKGAGLPGYCWKHSRPKIIENPGVNPNFIRSFDRDPAKLNLCLGLPISREYGFPASILLLLSNESKPLARGIDVWQCDSEKPSESQPLPPVELKETQNSFLQFDPEFQQLVCEQITTNRSTVFLSSESNALPEGCQFAAAIPFFNQHKIEDILLLCF